MPRYAWPGESTTTNILTALASMSYGFVRTALVLAKPERAKAATIADAVVGVGGLIAKGYTSNAIAYKVLEALGLSGFANLGVWTAAVYQKKANVPVWQPEKTTSKVVQTAPQFSPPAPVPAFVSPPAPVFVSSPVVTEPVVTQRPAAGGASTLEI